MPKYTTQVASGPSVMRSGGAFAVVGTTYAYTALSDETDSTYCKVSTGRTRPVDMTMVYPTLAAGERIVSVCPYVRSQQPNQSRLARVAVALTGWTPPEYNVPYVYEGMALNLLAGVLTPTSYEIAAQNGQFLVPSTGVEWDATSGGDSYPTLAFYDGYTDNSYRASFYEAGLYWYALKPATVAAPTTPVTTETTTQFPTCTAVVSSIVESWQKPTDLPDFLTGVTVEWSVYAGSLTAPAGTPVATWTSHHGIGTYGDGVTPTQLACSSTPPTALPNDALTLFARVSRDHPSNVAAWSAYAYRHWTQAVALPTEPTLTATLNDAAQAVAITVNAPSTSGYDINTCQVQVQRQMSLGQWRGVRGMTDLTIAVDTDIDCGDDLESDRDVENTYRARMSMWHTVDGMRRYSGWTSYILTDGPTAGTWNLKAVDLPAANWLEVPVIEKPSEASQLSSTMLEPLDRERPVVLLGVVGGFAGSLQVVAADATAIAALKALSAYRGIVYLEDAFGEVRWIVVTRVEWQRAGTISAPRRTATIEYVEVDSGLVIST